MTDSYRSETQLREDTTHYRLETDKWRLNVPRKGRLSSDIYDDIVSKAQNTLDESGVKPDDISLPQSYVAIKAAELAIEVADFAHIAGAETDDVLTMVGSITAQAVGLFKVEEQQG